MECELRVPEEHGSIVCDDNGAVPEITYRPVDRYDAKWVDKFIPIFWEYWAMVNEEDRGKVIEFNILGQKHKVLDIEAILYKYFNDGAKVQVAVKNNEIISFMLYHIAYECVVGITAMYSLPGEESNGLGKGLVNSLGKPVKKIIFQTRKLKKPHRLFELTEKYRKLIYDNTEANLYIWEMTWAE